MKPVRWILVLCFGALVATLGLNPRLRPEPSWKGHSLTEWLDAWDTNLRAAAFDTNNGWPPGKFPPSALTDDQIDDAVHGMGKRALPFLLKWAEAKPSVFETGVNPLLERLPWIQFRFESSDRKQSVACRGFQRYGTDAQPLLPELIRMSHSTNYSMRMMAYECAFFTRPPREIFLSLADQALEDKAAGCEEMAAQWMMERFPQEAEKRGLRTRFPEHWHGGEQSKEASSATDGPKAPTPL
jgi:hypothetical protein